MRGIYVRQVADGARQLRSIVLAEPPDDGLVVGSITDGVVLCVGAGDVLREDAVASRDRLAQAGVRILGVVLNRFTPQGQRYGRRYHYYEHEAYGDGPDPVVGSQA